MRKELFLPEVEGEARLLLLIDTFSSANGGLEGRTKLVKLDFLLRYPLFLVRALRIRNPEIKIDVDLIESNNIEQRMVRYRFGPWDPAYYALLGRLIGKRMIKTIHTPRGLHYATTEIGHSLAKKLAGEASWENTVSRIVLLKRNLNMNGSNLKKFIYDHFPEVSKASWGDPL